MVMEAWGMVVWLLARETTAAQEQQHLSTEVLIGFASTIVVTLGAVTVAWISNRKHVEKVRQENSGQHNQAQAERTQSYGALAAKLDMIGGHLRDHRRDGDQQHERVMATINKIGERTAVTEAWTRHHDHEAQRREDKIELNTRRLDRIEGHLGLTRGGRIDRVEAALGLPDMGDSSESDQSR